MNAAHRSAPAGRNGHVDLLRGLSVLVVLIGHFGTLGPFKGSLVVAFDFITRIAGNSYYAVVMFFVISGYLITATSLRRYGQLAHLDLREFWAFRLSRIAPPLLLLVVVNFALLAAGAPGFEMAGGVTVPQLLGSLFTLRFHLLYVSGGAFLAVWALLWSLTIEEIFYLVFPVLCRVFRQLRWLCPVLLSAVVLGPIYRSEVGWNSLYFFTGCCGHLALGCLIAIVSRESRIGTWPASWRRALRVAGLAGLVLVAALADVHQPGNLVFGPTAAAAATALYLLGSAGADGTATPASFPVRLLQRMGVLSYELYLFHMPVYLLLRPVFHRLAAALGYYPKDLAIAVMCALLLAMAAWLARHVHEPALATLRRWLAPPRRTTPAPA